MRQNSLVSIIILSYKNYQYIYEAIDSVISQDYKNIEIVITNDGSDDFDKGAIDKYFKNKKIPNIKKIVINNNSTNIGTVKNINKAIKLSKGKFIIIFAADDAMYNSNVVSKLIDTFDTLPKKELIVTSQVGMFNTKLKKLIQLFVSEKNKKKIAKLSPKKLFAEMATQCILPGPGTCYKRELFYKYGFFDEKYFLIEDYSSALKLSRLGVRYNFFDFISFKHRDGGVSHGNIICDTSAGKKYDLDILNIFKNEIYPYLDLLNKKQKKIFLKKYRDHKWQYIFKYQFKDGTKAERRKFVLDNFSNIAETFFNRLRNEILDQLKGKKFKVFILGIIFLVISNATVTTLPSQLSQLIKIFGLLLILISITSTIQLFIKKYLAEINDFLKSIL